MTTPTPGIRAIALLATLCASGVPARAAEVPRETEALLVTAQI
jgi:hypothetical protein